MHLRHSLAQGGLKLSNHLPAFQKVHRRFAVRFINDALSGPRGACLINLIEYEDHHFRAVFRRSYFEMNAGADMPSKSQWNTLKKKLKRRNHSVFVFRKYGAINCGKNAAAKGEQDCLYLDFGFLPA